MEWSQSPQENQGSLSQDAECFLNELADERADRGYAVEDPPLCPGAKSMAPCGSESARLLEQQLNQKESHLHFLETVLQTN